MYTQEKSSTTNYEKMHENLKKLERAAYCCITKSLHAALLPVTCKLHQTWVPGDIYVCMFICIYICVCVYIYIYIYIYVKSLHAALLPVTCKLHQTWVPGNIYVCMFTYMYVYIHT